MVMICCDFRSLPAACRVGDEAVDQLKRPHLEPQVAPGQRCDARRPRLSNPHRTGLVTVLRSPSNDKKKQKTRGKISHTHKQTNTFRHTLLDENTDKTRQQQNMEKKKLTQTQKLATSCCAGLYILYMTFDTATPL